jgi:hypothetical protein
MHFRIKGKRSKIRFIPINAAAQRMIEDYLALTGHRGDVEGALFRPVANNRTGRLPTVEGFSSPRAWAFALLAIQESPKAWAEATKEMLLFKQRKGRTRGGGHPQNLVKIDKAKLMH